MAWDSGSISQRFSKRMQSSTRWLERSDREYRGTTPMSNGTESADDYPNPSDWYEVLELN